MRELRPESAPVLIENAPGAGERRRRGSARACCRARTIRPRARRRRWCSTPGTFEAYQGLDLLFAAATGVLHARPDARFVLAGGAPDAGRRGKAHVRGLGIDGQRDLHRRAPGERDSGVCSTAADVLVSPRSRGTNTPLKIYQYLRSGRVIVATRLLTHTQVLDDGVAILTDATPAAFAAGILQAIGDPAAAARIGDARAQLADTKYSYEAYLARTREADRRLGPDSSGDALRERRVTEPASRDAGPITTATTIYADPAMARVLRRARFSGPIGELLAETQARDPDGVLRDRSTARGSSTSAPARPARRWSSPRRGAHVTAVDASDEMLRVARGPRRVARRRHPLRGGDAHHLAHSRRLVRRRRQPARADAHAGLAPVRRRAVPRQRAVGSSSTIPPLAIGGGGPVRLATRLRRAAGANVEAYRVLRRGAIAQRLRAPRASASPHRTGNSSCRSRCTSARIARAPRERLEGVLARPGSAAPGRVARDGAGRAVRVLVTGATGFTGGHLARALARRGVAGACAGPQAGSAPATCAAAGIALVDRRPRAPRGPRRRAARGVDVVYQRRRAVSSGRPARRRPITRVNAESASAGLIDAAAAGRRASRRPLQHRRRPRRHRAPAGERGRAAAAGRHLPGHEARRRARRAGAPPTAPASSSSSCARAASTDPAIAGC